MSVLLWIVLATLFGGLLSVIAAGAFLLIPQRHHPAILPHGVSFALGALLSAAFLDLLPDAVRDAGTGHADRIMTTVLAGILLFFVLEKLLLWRHCHSGDCDSHGHGHGHQPAGALIVVGDAIHNFVDGILIAAAFLTDIGLGMVTSLAVVTHEIPQEVGDFAILIESGYSRARAFFYNALSSVATLVGGIAAYFGLRHLHEFLPYLLALAASSFIYVAVADLIPNLHRKTTATAALQQVTLIVAGILLVYGVHGWTEGLADQLVAGSN